MGLLDSLLGAAQQTMGGQTAQGGGADLARLVTGLLANGSAQGGLAGLLQQLQAGGLGEQVQSWVSTGANQPVSGEQLSAALGDDVVGRLAQEAGVSQQEVGSQLSQLLPQLVDQLTPQGRLPPNDDLGALLGQLLGR